jgi:hypothetical protein
LPGLPRFAISIWPKNTTNFRHVRETAGIFQTDYGLAAIIRRVFANAGPA